jgi:secreted trypsin-like serine protease
VDELDDFGATVKNPLRPVGMALAVLTSALALSLAATAPASAIVGGQPATDGQIPVIASISALGWHGSSHHCAGVLVGTMSVLTTAGCVDGYTAGQLAVEYGGVDRTRLPVSNPVTKVDLHAAYDANSGRNNIAVLTLQHNIVTSPSAQAAVLPVPGVNADPAPGTTLRAAGWGRTSASATTLPTTLQYADLPVISHSACNTAYGAGTITFGMLCTHTEGNTAFACTGDAGDPLFEGDTVIGLITAKNGCDNHGKPDVAVRVGAFNAWVTARII